MVGLRKVAIDLNISRQAIQRIELKFQQHETLENLPKSGRIPDNTPKSERLLICAPKGNPKKTAHELLMKLKSIHTSVSTVKRILRKYGLIGWIAAKKHLLNERHVSSRLKWCKAYSMLDPCFWNDVISSDECRIELFSRRREYVGRQQGYIYSKIYHENCEIWR